MRVLKRHPAVAAGLLSWSFAHAAQELNAPPPTSASEATTAIESGFEPAPEVPPATTFSERMRKALEDTPAFVRDTEVTFKPRTYYFDQKKPGGQQQQAWAGGGSLAYRSGRLLDHLRVGAEVYTSQPIYAPDDQSGTLLLGPDQQGYTVVGQAYGEISFWDDEVLTLGRKEYDTPYANPQFNRMTPITFEGATFSGKLTGPLEHIEFNYLGGYLSRIKQRNSDRFIPMSAPVGLGDPDEGTYFAQVLFKLYDVSFGLAEYYTPDNFNIAYGEASYTAPDRGRLGLKLSAQYTGERSVSGSSVGSNALLSRNGGIQALFSYRHSVLALAGSKTASDGQVISPWGSNPSYTTAAIKNTNRAGESAFLARYSYEFSRLGIPGLSFTGVAAWYWDAQDPSTGASQQNEQEYDLILDYEVQAGPLRGLSLRLQRDVLTNSGDPESTRDVRVILNWRIPLI